MCGIIGILAKSEAKITYGEINTVLSELYHLSESRGKESAGLHIYIPNKRKAWTFKIAQRASQLLKSSEFNHLINGAFRDSFSTQSKRPATPLAILAHSRLVTNGTAELSRNNQPVHSGAVTMIHNGIVVNVDDLWSSFPHLKRTAEVDTEILAALTANEIQNGAGPAEATAKAFSVIRGAASIAWVHDQANWTILATNTGDLYRLTDKEGGWTVFASERYILDRAVAKLASYSQRQSREAIEWLPPGHGVAIELNGMHVHSFLLDQSDFSKLPALQLFSENSASQQTLTPTSDILPQVLVSDADESLLRYNPKRISALVRCSQCVLPETFPFIAFDDQGVCNYCHSYRPHYKDLDSVDAKRRFIESLQKYRRSDGKPDTLVAFSGGRDSSFGLHLIKKEFGLTPITFTYDWGMITDLARRNVARICGQLGIQNILVSADIKRKRDNIRNNVSAWLRKPDLGLVPLFMAGDKHFFRVTNQLKRQTGISLDLWCANPLENTHFKAGFCGVTPDFNKSRLDYLSLGRKAKMATYYARSFLTNPAYLNSSIPDTLGAFFAYYLEPRNDFYFIFNHFVWDEHEVDRTLRNEYDWELASDTTSTWRIGDGTAPFYNYIYVTARGFSEFDTFRSNQIREGLLSREEALESIIGENRPRAESLQWYLDTINLDFNTTIRRINELDTLGLHC